MLSVLVCRTSLCICLYFNVITLAAQENSSALYVYRHDDKYYFDIADSVLGRDILVVSRLSRSATGIKRSGAGGYGGYAGDKVNENIIRFEKGRANRLLLKKISFAERSSDSTAQGMFHAVLNSNAQPVVASFSIESNSKNRPGSVIDFTSFLCGDNDILFFSQAVRTNLQLRSFQADASYIRKTRSWPEATIIQSIKTYSCSLPKIDPAAPSTTGFASFELTTSLILLPAKPMRARYADPRVGYFAKEVTVFEPGGVKKNNIITRWRLEPKPQDMEKYRKGELVEPAKPIVFYIDPATPPKWVPYLVRGVNDWQPAFEQAGFKNAIIGRPAPGKNENPDWSIADARFSVIVYQASETMDASYSTVVDPRSGEIIECHIKWYHNVLKLLRNWYFIQASPNDPRARKPVFDDELMGELIRIICSHEIGHALGLSHNFGASAAYPVEKLRNKQWVRQNGHAPSIMDYARFNYVAQPGDGITGADLFPKINFYDRWAIEWGYKLIPDALSVAAEKDSLHKWIQAKAGDEKYRFGNGDKYPINDPRTQAEDLGNDPVKAGYYGIRNLQYVIAHLVEWTRSEKGDYEDLKELYNALTSQFTQYMKHAATNVGGIYETPKTPDMAGAVYEMVPETVQRSNVLFLNRQLFATPRWLLRKDIFDRTGQNGVAIMDNIQSLILNKVLDSRTIGKLIIAEGQAKTKSYTVQNLLDDLRKGIWTALYNHRPIDIYRRNLQNRYVDILQRLSKMPTTDAAQLTIPGIAKAELAKLKLEITQAIPFQKDPMSIYHLRDLIEKIGNTPVTKNPATQESRAAGK